MGSFLSDIEGREISIDRELLNSSHSKLVEYYSSYKSICEGYTINVPEYTHIFGPNQLSFQVWDSKNRGKIDAIQMFTGLITFSSISFEQKVKFLFELFDFNEEGFLYYENIALMLYNICNATYKIYSLNKTASHQAIELFLDQYFTQESQVSYEKLVRWTLQVGAVGQYCQSIGHEIEQLFEEKRIAQLSLEDQDQKQKQGKKLYFSQKEVEIDGKFMHKLEGLFQKRRGSPKQESKEMLNFEVNWVLGINPQTENVKYIYAKGQKAANERIVYTVGKIIIIYFPKLNAQHYYKEHKQGVSVIEISKGQKLAASGEEGEYPQIHIWDLTTKTTFIKFKKLHKETIKFIKFLKNDKELITASQHSNLYSQVQTPIIILNLQTQQIIMSTYLQYPIIGLAFNHQFPLKYSDFLAVSHTEIAFFSQQRDSYQIFSSKIKVTDGIQCFAYHPKGFLLTCHRQRKLFRWDQKLACQEIAYSSTSEGQVKEMTFVGEQQLFLLDQSDVQVIRFEQNLISRVYLLRLGEAKLFNLRLIHMEKVKEDGLLLVSDFGDLFKVSELDHLERPSFHKYYQVFRLSEPRDYCQAPNNKVVMVAGHLLYAIDKYEKQLCSLMRFDWDLERVEIIKNSMILLGRVDEKTRILISVHNIDFKIKETHKFEGDKICLILAEGYLLVFRENELVVYHLVQERYFESRPHIHNCTFGYPIAVVNTSDPQVFLLFNELQEIFKVTLTSHSQVEIKRIDKLFQPLLTTLSANYSSNMFEYPFSAHLRRNIFAVGQNNGNILMWDSIMQSQSYRHSALKIAFHCGRISKLLIKGQELISLGIEDGMALILKHRPYIELPQTEPFIEEEDDNSFQLPSEVIQSNESEKEQLSKDRCWLKVDEIGGNFLKQSEVEMVPLQENENSDLKQIIKEIINPKDKVSYETQLREGVPLNSTQVSLHIEGVYGLTSRVSRSVFYHHAYNKEPSPIISVSPTESKPQSSEHEQQLNQDFRFAKTLLLPLDDGHLGCVREVVYAADRLCVLRQREENKQRIYDFHRRRVTCLAIHPDRQLIISCEESSTVPTIHLWDADQMSTRAIIPTRHQNVIIRASFSRDGEWVVTLGGKERYQSVQITSWRDEEEIAFRLIEGEVLRDILFNPYNRQQISVVGLEVIKVYKYSAGILVLVDECRTPHDFLVVTYTSSVYGDSIQSDLVVANAAGDIGIFICGKFIVSKEKAHDTAIWCLRIAELFGYKRVLISGGAEGLVKIWDIKFNELSRKNIKEELYSLRLNGQERPDCGITSLDVFQCLKGHGVDRPPTLLLIACSDGSVLQATIHNEFQGYQARSLVTNETQQLKQKINFDVSLLFSAPPNISATKFQIYQNTMVTFNSTSLFIRLWNIHTWERSFIYALPELPSVLCFMRDRPILLAAYKKLTVNYFSLFEIEFQNLLLKGIKFIGEIPLMKGHGEPTLAAFSAKDSRLALLCSQGESSCAYLFGRLQNGSQLFTFRGKVQSNSSASFMEYSSSGEVIMVGWSDSKKTTSTMLDQQYVLKCYSSDTQQQLPVTRFDFRRFDFSKRIKAAYVHCSHMGKIQQDMLSKYTIRVSAMTQFDRYLLLGTINGEILVVEGYFFMRKFQEERCFVRSFIVCDSAIESMEVQDDMLYVSSQLGEGVVKIGLNLQEAWGLPAVGKDPYSQSMTAEYIESKLKNVYSKRRKIQAEEQMDFTSESGITLRLTAVIGRSAFSKRNNIFVDLKDCIISFSGCNILIMKHSHSHKLEQIVLKPDPTPHSIHPQISAMALGDCKRLLVVGTAEEQSKLLVWNISTNTYFFQISLNGYVSVSIIKLSLSTRHAAVVAVTPKSTKNLLYIDLQSRTIIGVYRLVTNEIGLNDICFAGAEDRRVLGCGPNYMGQWVFKNGILNARRYSLGSGQDLSDIKASGIIFYSLVFIEDMAISSGSDGYLYVWREGRLAKRQNAHPGHAVLSLYAATNSKIFASGGTNGRVVIWKVWSSLIIQHQGEYPKEGNLKFPVQSISMTRQTLVVGDTSGSIMQFAFGGEESHGYQTLMAPFDHEYINSCAFNTSSKRLYVVTDAQGWGTLAIFDTITYEKVREERIQFKSALVRMLLCRLSNRIFFVMKTYIYGYIMQSEGKEDRGKALKIKWQLKCQAGIKTAALSSRENYMAVLIAQSSLHNSKIEIYNLQVLQGQFYAVYKVEENIPASIDLIDFCVDHDYLLYQGPDQEQTIIDLMTKDKIKPGAIESQLEWSEEAKKTSASVADIAATYSQENRLLRLVQVMNKFLVATDQIGSVRVFRYPVSSKGVASQVYIEHLNEVYICVISPDSRLLVTVGREDRAMHFWEFVDREE